MNKKIVKHRESWFYRKIVKCIKSKIRSRTHNNDNISDIIFTL